MFLDPVPGLQQQADALVAGDDLVLARLPDGEREDDVAVGQGDAFGRFAFGRFRAFSRCRPRQRGS